MRKLVFNNDCYFHIYNRGVDRRILFQEAEDYQRFLLGLREFNTIRPAHLATQSSNEAEPRKELVEIISFCLMPNHYHLLLKQKAKDGIHQFMHKLGTGYTMFFNKKWNRSGVLFQGSFKAKAIENDEYLIHLSRYIHLNPVNLIEPSWKKEGIKNTTKIRRFLLNYRWSSYLSYIKNSDSDIIASEIIQGMLNSIDYEEFTLSWTGKDTILANDIKQL